MFGTSVAGDLPGPEWLRALRLDAAEGLVDASLPTTDEEVWRYSRINELDLDQFAPSATPASSEVPASVAWQLESLPPRAALVVLRDGFVVHSELDAAWVSKGVWVGPVASAPNADQVLGSVIETPADVFGRMNVAYGPDPLLVRVPSGVALDLPIVVVDWVGTAGVAAFPHTVVQLGEASEATVVEWQTGDDVAALVAPIAELDIANEARLTHVTVQQRGNATWQIAEQAARVGKQANFTGHQIGLGGDYARSRVDCRLVGRGATGNLRAAYFGEREQMLDFRTFQDHLAPDTTSDLLFKGAVGGTSRSVYTGLIHVGKEAHGTNAFQTNRNVKLSEGAWAESVPNLEIENNDVRCSHASTVGPIDEDQRFYLESRGVPPDVAERLIVAGFFDEVLRQIPIPELADQLEAEIDRRLAPGAA
jgi:Fe-S cluster assembly protein SufD